MNVPPLYDKELGSKLDDAIKKAFPFDAVEPCKPDGNAYRVADTNFRLNGHLVVLYNAQICRGIRFRTSEPNTGNLNIFTQDVKFEVDIPTIDGQFYVISEAKTIKPVHIRGSFKLNHGENHDKTHAINYHTAMAKGIVGYILNGNSLAVANMAIDFELSETPSVTLCSHEANGSIGELDTDRADNGSKMAEVMWPSVKWMLYWILRDKISSVSHGIHISYLNGENKFTLHEKLKRDRVCDLLNDIIIKVKRKLRAKMTAGRLSMPDIDVPVAPRMNPDIWGRFKATSGWLGNVGSMRVKAATAVHARSNNELVIVGKMHFHHWRYCYDEYTMEGNTGSATGKIVRNLGDAEGFITIRAIRDDEGATVLKLGTFEYVDNKNIINTLRFDVTHLGDFDCLKRYIYVWMTGFMEAEKPALNKVINDCLNEILVNVDLFAYWDELDARQAEI